MIKSLCKKGVRTAAQAVQAFAALAMMATVFGGQAAAQIIGLPVDKQLDLHEPFTPVARDVNALHHLMLYIITGITIFVLALLIWTMIRYNAAANKTPSKFTHNTTIEVIWTVLPVVILIVIAVPSVKLLIKQEDQERVVPEVLIKATGKQWLWSYEYPELKIAEYDSTMIGKGRPVMNAEVRALLAEFGYTNSAWKYATDTAVVVPVGKQVVVAVTGGDVIHSWTVLGFGVKADGIPGRTNNTHFIAEKEGIYFGQCSELCGKDHSYMPIVVKVVSQAEFDAWAKCAAEKTAYDCDTPTMKDMMARASKEAKKVAAEKLPLKAASLTPAQSE